MNAPAISIIVPFHNSESTLHACLESIANQTLESIEIILVDDGSTDTSSEIAHLFAISYTGSCTLLSQENKGPSAARNRGLSAAKGRFVAFVDSDDVVDRTLYEKMLKSANEHDSDIVSCGRIGIDAMSGRTIKTKIPKYDVLEGSVRTNPSIAKRVTPLMCDKMFRRSIIVEHNLSLDEGVRHGEDYLFSSHYRLHTRRVSAVGEALYYYTMSNADSLSGGNAHVLDIPIVCRKVVDLYHKEGILESVSDELMFVFAGYYIRKCKALASGSDTLAKFKRDFKRLFVSTFGYRWVMVIAKRIYREEKGFGRFSALLKVM